MIAEGEKTIPGAEALMGDKQFQDWLLRVDLMRRVKGWQDVQPVWKNGGTDELLTNTEWVIVDKLLTNRGYIVAHTQIAPLDSRNCIHYSVMNISRIRSKLENPELIFSAPNSGFGYGVGIESLRLRNQCGRLLYRLWQDLGTGVPGEELALGLYGYADSSEYHAIRTLLWRLRHDLTGSKATILFYPQVPKGGYALIEEEGIAA